MATASVTNTFSNDTNADATEVNANFSDLVTFLNGSVIHKDASVAFTAVPSGPATDPSTDNHLARKAYVDAHDLVATVVEMKVRRVAAQTITSGSTYQTVVFDTEDSDASGMHASGVVTFPSAGIWAIAVSLTEAAGGTDVIVPAKIRKVSGTSSISETAWGQMTGTGGSTTTTCQVVYAASGASFDVQVKEDGALGDASITGLLWVTKLMD